ncbi:hypothetical protein ACRXFS_00005, partial [Klebsiella pneumoniae]
DVFAGKKSAQIREILISESAWEEMTCLFAPSLSIALAVAADYAQARELTPHIMLSHRTRIPQSTIG